MKQTKTKLTVSEALWTHRFEGWICLSAITVFKWCIYYWAGFSNV